MYKACENFPAVSFLNAWTSKRLSRALHEHTYLVFVRLVKLIGKILYSTKQIDLSFFFFLQETICCWHSLKRLDIRCVQGQENELLLQYSNILKIYHPKNENLFSDKNSDIFHISTQNIDRG